MGARDLGAKICASNFVWGLFIVRGLHEAATVAGFTPTHSSPPNTPTHPVLRACHPDRQPFNHTRCAYVQSQVSAAVVV